MTLLEADSGAAAAPATNFTRIGGAGAVDRLVEAFYARMDTLPEAATIRAMHGSDLNATKDVLKRYLGEWMGGPKLFRRARSSAVTHAPYPLQDRDA